MKTCNYNLNVMLPMQIGKEVIFNESQRFFDAFCNFAITAAVENLPEKPEQGVKYIKSSPPQTGHIFYWDDHLEKWNSVLPKNGMIFYVIKEGAFFIFQDCVWQRLGDKIDEEKSAQHKVFTSSGVKYKVKDSGQHYIYLDNDCEIEVSLPEGGKSAILIIKQNVDKLYKINWPYNILWPDKTTHQITTINGAINVVEILPLVEGSYFIARIFGKNFQY